MSVSLVVSLTTTAMMCGAVLRPHDVRREGRLARATARRLDPMTRGYHRSLGP